MKKKNDFCHVRRWMARNEAKASKGVCAMARVQHILMHDTTERESDESKATLMKNEFNKHRTHWQHALRAVCVRACRCKRNVSTSFYGNYIFENYKFWLEPFSHLAGAPACHCRMAWRVYKLLFYVREANVKIRYFCLCRHRSRRRRAQRQSAPSTLHCFSTSLFLAPKRSPLTALHTSPLTQCPYSHIPASSIFTSQWVAFSNKIKTIQFAAKRIFQYIKVSQSAISQLLPPSPGSNRRAWKRENVCAFPVNEIEKPSDLFRLVSRWCERGKSRFRISFRLRKNAMIKNDLMNFLLPKMRTPLCLCSMRK